MGLLHHMPVEPATRAVENKFDPEMLAGRIILSSYWVRSNSANMEVIIEGEELPAGVTAKVVFTDADVMMGQDQKTPERQFADIFVVMAANEAGESVPFGKKGDGGKIVTNREGEVVGIIAGGGQDSKGRHQTALVPADQFKVGGPA